ncbi:MAG TPA: protein kinase [Terriglobales bacterium]|nr:protein kinase [Terriglobales bacterium]
MNLASGTKLGPYEIVSLLGAGGMGEVYRARDSRLRRDVAIKVLPAALSEDADRLRRFEQEALATAALNHPNILAVFDIGTSEGSPYVVSELLEGETLRERLRGGTIPVRKALDYALQIAHGLAAAHEKGIIHRDLKPDNLFVTKDARIKILDFGLAKLTQADAGSHTSMTATHGTPEGTEAGLVMGTAGYMSPEQVRGIALDSRSDIFSFGAILYEMLSGKRAFHGETPADTMSSILKEEPPELSETNRNVPPALERIVHHCLEKNPESRFHSASDIAFDLEHLSGLSGSTARLASATETPRRSKLLLGVAAGVAVAGVLYGLGWWTGKGRNIASQAEYQQITFRTGSIGNARFTPDGSIVYSAIWDGEANQLYMSRVDDPGSRELGIKNAELLAISKTGEMAICLNSRRHGGYAQSGTLARVPLSGGTPREVLDNVEDADWSASGDSMAIIHYLPENNHWRLEYPMGKVLIDGIDWISHPKISPDGKWIAFADHENPGGDDEGSLAVIAADGTGKERKLSSGWTSLQGILWSPAGDEIWFTSTKTGSAQNPRAVTLSGKLRTITNVPGGMWLEDIRNGVVLTVANHQRLGIRGLAPGAKEERELGWFGWSELRDMTPDGHRIIFEEEGDGGGPNYTVFLRDTDGSPPARIGEGRAVAISPDGKWAVTESSKGGPLVLVPTGAGEARTLTHDAVSYIGGRFFPDGKSLLAVGIEAGHGGRDYRIDLNSGDSKPITPEGISGTAISPDGQNIAVTEPDGKRGIWPLDGSGFRAIPGLESKYGVVGWTADGGSVYVAPLGGRTTIQHISRVNLQTGKIEPWKTVGDGAGTGVSAVMAPRLSRDGDAYAYLYVRVLSEAYVVTGLK